MPWPMRLVRLGHKRKEIDDLYPHGTDQVTEDTLRALQQRWKRDAGWTWQETRPWSPKRHDLFGFGLWSGRPCYQFAPKTTDGPPMKIVDGPQTPRSGVDVTLVGDTGIEPVTSSV